MAGTKFTGGRIILGSAFSGYTFSLYMAGTTTPITTYQDSALTIANTFPVTLDANGAAQIWFTGNAKVVFKTPTGNVVYTDDNINPTTTTSTTAQYNLVQNGSFEVNSLGTTNTAPDLWTLTLYSTGVFLWDVSNYANGTYSAKFTSTGGGGGYLTSTSQFAVTPSRAYIVSFQLKSSVANVRNVVQVNWYQANGSASSTATTSIYDESSANPTSWTLKSAAVTAPSDAAFATITFIGCHNSNTNAGSTWFDDVRFVDGQVDAVPIYNNGLTSKGTLTMSGAALNYAAEVSLASAATVNIGAAASNNVYITGTTTITAFDTVSAGIARKVRFAGALTLTHNGTSLILPGSANITTAANDCAEFESLGSGNWICKNYTKSNGFPVNKSNMQVFGSSGTFTPVVTGTHLVICIGGGGGGSGGGYGNGSNVAGTGGCGGGGGKLNVGAVSLTVGVAQTVTIGGGGGGGSGAVDGSAGGTTSFGALVSATGGVSGAHGIAGTVTNATPGTHGGGYGGGGAGGGATTTNSSGGNGTDGVANTGGGGGGGGGGSGANATYGGTGGTGGTGICIVIW